MKKLGDVMTIILLLAAFGIAFGTGFVSKNSDGDPMLATNVLAIISILGSLLLLGVGSASTMYSRVKNNMVTKSFTVFCCVQAFAVIGMITIMIMLWTGMFSVESRLIRALYIIFTLTITMGYVDALLYTDSLELRDRENGADDEEDENGELEEIADETYCDTAEQEVSEDRNNRSGFGSGDSFMGF